MAVTTDNPAPYTATVAITDFLDKYRNRGMSTPITGEVLERSGISVTMVPRTLQAIQVLELVNEDGSPTDTLEGLRLAKSQEYQSKLEEWLKAVYADAFLYIDPSTDSETAIRDAFRGYIPTGQQSRMVKLFIGLCEEAGIREKSEKESKSRTRKVRTYKATVKKSTAKSKQNPKDGQVDLSLSGLPPAIYGLINSLPSTEKGWTDEQREKFLTTFGAVLDFCYPIVTESEDDGDSVTDED